MTDPTEYSADSPQAHDIRVRRGANVLDYLTGSSAWRSMIDPAEVDGANIIQLCERAGFCVTPGMAWDTIDETLANCCIEADLADYGLNCFEESCQETGAAWVRLLTPYRAAVASLAA